MTMTRQEANTMILDRMVRPLTETELEETAGGDLFDELKLAWRASKCMTGFHDYNIRFEHKPYCGTWILSRAVETCKYCGYTKYDAWEIK